MSSMNERWEKNIAKAMNETGQSTSNSGQGSSFYLPNWFPYGICLVFGFLLAKTLVFGIEAHPVNENREYETGSKVALLMVAEDVESYLNNYGELPDEVPSPIASVMSVSYEKLSNDHFRLTMPYGDSNISFDAREDKWLLD